MNRQFLIIALIGLSAPAAMAQTNLLFVGNSFTYGDCAVEYYNSSAITDANRTGMGGVPGIFKQMTMQAGLTNYNVTIEAVSGQSLIWHYENEAAIISQNWNIVVLQDQSTYPLPTSRGGDPTDFNAGVSNCINLVHSGNAAATVFLYDTWPYPLECYPSGSAYYGVTNAIQAMANDLHTAYYGAYSNYHCAGVGPVGDGFVQAINEGFAGLNPYTGIPAGQFNIWCSDDHHSTTQGYYLAAAVFLGTITGVDPRTLSVGAGSVAAGLGLSTTDASNMNWIAYEMALEPRLNPNILINTNNNYNWNTASNWSLGHSPTNTDLLLITTDSPAYSQIANSLGGGAGYGSAARNLSINCTNAVSIAANLTLSTQRTLPLTGGTNAFGHTDLIDLSPSMVSPVLIATGTLGTLLIPLSSDSSFNIENAQASLTLGAISVITGNYNVTKNGPGTLLLAGTNTFGVGKTFTINAGTVYANTAVSGTNSATGYGSVSVSAAGTLGGTGQITPGSGAQVAVASGGTVAPGTNGIGTLTFNGVNTPTNVLAMAAGANFRFKLNTGFQSDRIALLNGAAGAISFAGNTINFNDLSGGSLANGAYTLFTASAANNYAGIATDGSGYITNGLSIGTGLATYTANLQLVGSSIVLNISGSIPVPPAASFSATPTNGMMPLLVNFTDNSTGTITSNFWSFGDGGTTNFTIPTSLTYTYSTAGVYTVTLIATGPDGVSTNVQAAYITVTPNTFAVGTGSSPTNGGTTSAGGTVNYGSNVTVCATPNGCYSFLYWTANGALVSTSVCDSFVVSNNQTWVANFVNGQGTLATDNAANSAYGSAGDTVWTSGLNGGTGFGPWVLATTSSNSDCNGFFIYTSLDGSPEVSPGIDVNYESWGLYANEAYCNSSDIAVAYRAFASGPIQTGGGQLLIDMDSGSNDVSGSSVGFILRNGNATNSAASYATGARLQFYLAGGSNDYTVVDAAGVRDSGIPLTYSGLHLTFTLGTNDSYTLTVLTYGTGAINTITGTLGGTAGSALNSIALFNNNAGTDSPHNVFFNSLVVTYSSPFTYTFNTAPSPANAGTTSAGGVVNCGSNVTVCATPYACYNFLNWTLNGSVVSTSACATVSVTGNDTFVANFTNSTTDTVGDGIPDCWRQEYFGVSGTTTNGQDCATCDADGTGQNNLFKYVAGLNPTNPASVFTLNIASATNQPPQNNLSFTPLASGRTYTPQFTTNLVGGVWLPLATYLGPVTNGTDVTITDTNPIPPQEFYRIDISLP